MRIAPWSLNQSSSTRCPPTVRSCRRAKIVGNLCEIYHFAPLCLVLFPEIRVFPACTCTMYHNIQSHAPSKSNRRTVAVYQISRHSPKVSRSKENISIAYVRAMCIVHVLCICTMQLIIKCNVPSNYAH